MIGGNWGKETMAENWGKGMLKKRDYRSTTITAHEAVVFGILAFCGPAVLAVVVTWGVGRWRRRRRRRGGGGGLITDRIGEGRAG